MLEGKEIWTQILVETSGSKCHSGNACMSRPRPIANMALAKSLVASEVLHRFKWFCKLQDQPIILVYPVTFGFQQTQNFFLPNMNKDKLLNTLRTGLFKLFKRPFPGFLKILIL